MNEKYKIKYLKYKNKYLILKSQVAGMENLPTTHHNECSICQELIGVNNPVRRCFINDHMFHTECINKWLTKHNTCPDCREPFAPPQQPVPPVIPPLLNLNRANLLVRYPNNLPNLQNLSLTNNQIQNIDPQTFQNLPNLQEIYLHGNQIQNIDLQTFQNLPSLQEIGLNNNQIQNIDPHTFQNLPNLRYIKLSHNQIQNIDPQTFQNLPNLQNIVLSHSQIQNIDPQTFQNLPNLQYINLYHNQIQNIDQLIASLPGVTINF